MAFSKCELPLSTPKRQRDPKDPLLSEPKHRKKTDDSDKKGEQQTLTKEKLKLALTWNPKMTDCLPAGTQFSNEGEKKLAEQSWLSVTDFGLQCIACKRAGLAGPWCDGTAGVHVKDLRMWFVSKHAGSKAHVAAVKKMVGFQENIGAPSISEFEDILKKLQKGASQRSLSGDASYSDKTALIAWSLQEAVLNEVRDHLLNAETISLTRDARRQRLLVRYGACDSSGRSHSGMLGMARDFGENAGEIVKATRHILKRVCTIHSSCPRWYDGPSSYFNEELKRIELVTTDAAANEILATNIGAGRRSSRLETEANDEKILTPNLVMVGRDKAHSFRRLMTRPYASDPFLDGLVDDWIRDNGSMIQKIQNSWDLKRVLVEEVAESDAPTGTSMRSLRAAKHRFESLASPMGRALLHLPAFLKTMERMAAGANDLGKRAAAFLQGLSAEKLVQLALLADGMDEAMLLVRTLRRERRGEGRIDAGLRRKTQDDESIAGWLRNRRREVGKALQNLETLDWDLAEVEGSDQWTEGHDREKQFQQDKQKKQMLEALEYGTLEKTDELQQELEERKKMDAEQDKRLIADRRRRENARRRTKMDFDWEFWSGKSCWVELPTEDFVQGLQGHNLVVTQDRWAADIFVVGDAAEPPERVKWIASLLGKTIIDGSALKGKGGMLLVFRPARQTKLNLHITKGFRDCHGAIFNLIRSVLALIQSSLCCCIID
eukprot:Skav217147  [mRNA]  locus=scaffold2621:2863:6211:+ [translate_table: standard]